jgi:hypothetical protein
LQRRGNQGSIRRNGDEGSQVLVDRQRPLYAVESVIAVACALT